MPRGGARPGAGRKTKAEELAELQASLPAPKTSPTRSAILKEIDLALAGPDTKYSYRKSLVAIKEMLSA